jgi:transcriptional regulator with XRE-family HTH domain
MESNNRKHYPRLRELRVGAGLNQTEIADILDMQQNQYSRYERGERELPMHLFVVLAKHYKVSLDYMVGLSDNRERA